MKFKEIKPGMVIHCPKEEDARALLEHLDRLGYVWCNGANICAAYSRWHEHCDRTGYQILGDREGKITNGNVNSYLCKITEFSDLIETEPRFKVGDKVMLHYGLDTYRIYDTYTLNKKMLSYEGEPLTVAEILSSKTYRIKEDNGEYVWTDEMLEPVDDSPINSDTDSPMSAAKVLMWLKMAESKVLIDLFDTDDMTDLFDVYMPDDIIRKITAYEAAKKEKPVEVEYGWKVLIYDENNNLEQGEYFYFDYTKEDAESIAKKTATQYVRQTGKPYTWRVDDACRVKGE